MPTSAIRYAEDYNIKCILLKGRWVFMCTSVNRFFRMTGPTGRQIQQGMNMGPLLRLPDSMNISQLVAVVVPLLSFRYMMTNI